MECIPESEAASSLRLGRVDFFDRAEGLGDITEHRLRNLKAEAVGEDVSSEETKCFGVASPAGEEALVVAVLTAELKRELSFLALERGIGWRLCFVYCSCSAFPSPSPFAQSES